MAIQAALTKQVLRRHAGCQAICIVSDARMSALRVTTLAKEWGALREHPRMVRSMRVVARCAIFSHRRMLPQVRTALLRVALKAGIVHGLPRQLQFRCSAMRAVTTGAGHLAFTQWMRIRFQRVAFAECMTVIAFFGLRRCPEHRVIGSVNLMTAGAADFVVVMRATVPRESDISFMASETHTVLRLDACGRVGGETNNGWPLPSAPDPAGMRSTGTVAGFTLQLTLAERAARISRRAMFCPEYGQDRVITMTGDAGICAAPAVGNISVV
jgi:hypothetical protein